MHSKQERRIAHLPSPVSPKIKILDCCVLVHDGIKRIGGGPVVGPVDSIKLESIKSLVYVIGILRTHPDRSEEKARQRTFALSSLPDRQTEKVPKLLA